MKQEFEKISFFYLGVLMKYKDFFERLSFTSDFREFKHYIRRGIFFAAIDVIFSNLAVIDLHQFTPPFSSSVFTK